MGASRGTYQWLEALAREHIVTLLDEDGIETLALRNSRATTVNIQSSECA